MAMTERVLEARGICYRTNTFEPNRPTLVFVHGVSGSSSAWRPYEARFASQCNLVTFDLRGHGRSGKPARYRDYAIPNFVDDLTALLAHLEVRTCFLVGHSFAVLILLEFLRRSQTGIVGVVLLSPDFDASRRVSAKLLKAALGPVPLLDRLPFRPPLGRRIDYARFPDSGDWNVPRMAADIGNTTWRVYLYCTKHALGVHAADVLAGIRVPVLLVHGRRDTVFPVASAIEMAAAIPKADLVILEDADHILVLNRPREVGDAIERFLNRHARLTLEVSPQAALRAKPAAEADDRDEHDAGHDIADDPYRQRHRADRVAKVIP